jgi:acetyl-CoA synthetase
MGLEHLDRLRTAWTPSAGAFAASPVGRMAARHGLKDMASLQAKVSEDPNWYWAAAAEDLGIRWTQRYEEIVDLSDGPEFAQFFAGGRLNWADCAVDRWVDLGRGNATAIAWEGDDGSTRELSYADLKQAVDQTAGALLRLGVQIGDTVGLVLPMIPEAAVSILAIARIGAIAVPMFSGYGTAAIRERVHESDARLVITCDSFRRRGKTVNLKATIDSALAGLPVRHVLVVERTGDRVPMSWPRDIGWDRALSDAQPVREAFSMDAQDPCLLLFTSGSTGRPKGCVHTHAGLPYKVAVEARHGFGLDETGTMLWLTDMGWIMGTFAVATALLNGGTAAMFEGTPDWPEPDRLWSVAARLGVTVLGISPTLIRSLARHGEKWPQAHELGRLRALGSTGEPWNLDPWMWCFRHVGKERVPIVNVSGGTECGGSLLSGCVTLPVKPMSFTGPTLGMATDVVDDDGKSVRGEVGELVVRAPWPGMTKGLWREPERYLDSYWLRYQGMWHQGDFAYVDPDGFWHVLGRSDDTMNVAGKRVGPAEVESIMVDDYDVIEAAAVGVPDSLKGEAMVVFLVLRDGADLQAATTRLAEQVRAVLGPALVPNVIRAVAELPKTRSGKVLRRLVRAVYLGQPVGDTSSLENPGALDNFPTAKAAKSP